MEFRELDFTPMLINEDYRRRVYENYKSNIIIKGYYEKLADTYKKHRKMHDNIKGKIDRLTECQKYWEIDYYQNMNIKEYLKSYYCKDKFCLNCKKWRQAQRTKKFLPELARYDNDLYFVTFTVPNVTGDKVKETISNIFKAHRRLIHYLDGTKNTKLLNFKKYGFIGGLRVLEISINRVRKEKYHVHIHCAYILKDFKLSKAYIVNRYSIDHSGKRAVRKFTNEEVELQKIWFYLYENINLKTSVIDINNFKSINPLTKRSKTYINHGYSVTIDKFLPGQYQEMFKYMIKDTATYLDENGDFKESVISYDEFFTLYFATANVRQLESYGVLSSIEENDLIDDDDVELIYDEVIKHLKLYDNPKFIYETLEETLKSDSIYITKKKIYSYMRRIVLDDIREHAEVLEVNNKIDNVVYKDLDNIIREMMEKNKIIEKYNDRYVSSKLNVEFL